MSLLELPNGVPIPKAMAVGATQAATTKDVLSPPKRRTNVGYEDQRTNCNVDDEVQQDQQTKVKDEAQYADDNLDDGENYLTSVGDPSVPQQGIVPKDDPQAIMNRDATPRRLLKPMLLQDNDIEEGVDSVVSSKPIRCLNIVMGSKDYPIITKASDTSSLTDSSPVVPDDIEGLGFQASYQFLCKVLETPNVDALETILWNYPQSSDLDIIKIIRYVLTDFSNKCSRLSV
ncbi:hypothetical protein BGX21_008582 [Mortierella sp. AD011]|nr:hypothetical protein BGX20_008457 [Mortierella sp. AD010]KAF9397709.1 hypothetical protein BGX21_008582 [Mortierella sp. AD011]